MKKRKVVVLGVGNLLLGDEGVGIHALRLLARRVGELGDVKLVDGGTSPEFVSLLDEETDKLIILDAVRCGGRPGTVYRIDADELDVFPRRYLSLHGIGVFESIELLQALGKRPRELVIVGMEPERMDPGTELSPAAKEKLSEMADLALREATSVD